MRKVVLVLGMHRSATSLTTEILSSYGLFVGDKEDLWEADQDNQRGYFENKNVVLLNDKILYENRMHWAMLKKKNDNLEETNYKVEINRILNDMLKNAGYNQALLLKDPRMCITEPIWKKQFDAFHLDEYIVMVFRHPYEVAKSLEIRDNISFTYALKMWFYNNFSALNNMAMCKTLVMVLNHNDFFTAYDRQIKKIEDFLRWTGTKGNLSRIIDATLRHNNVNEIHEKIDIELENMVFELYSYLIELSLMEKVVVSEKKLTQFSEYLRRIVVTSYLPQNDDMNPRAFKNCLGKEKKFWCMYQLQNNVELLVSGFQRLFKEKNIISLNLYGNGTLTKDLLPILEKTGTEINMIFEKNPVRNNKMGKYKNKIVDINEAEHMETDILNTAVNYGLQIQNELLERFGMCRILDLYDLICECIC